ncbi:MAG: serine--tRNA ligase, partial [Akkermansia sp.]
MLDIREIRDNPEAVKERLKPRGGESWKLVDDVLASDEMRRTAETERQILQSERNATSKQIGMMKKKGEDSSAIESRVRSIGDRIKELDLIVEQQSARQIELLMNIPNLPHIGCPIGSDETFNPEIKKWGQKPDIAQPKDHVELATALGMISFEDAARITGSGFIVYRGKGARLERALINFLLDTQTLQNGYQEVGVPFIAKRECMEGTGQLPKFEDDMYGTEEQQFFLVPTAEVPVTNLYRDTLLPEDRLPIKMTAYTPCFRREAGSAGRDNRGMIRVHQFDKVELVKIVKPETSFDELELLLADAESIL